MTALPAFAQLNFGRRDAHDEATYEPHLLLNGFYDYREAASRVEAGEAYLLLGPKGAGKSAVLEHIGLKWNGVYDRFFTLWDLRRFPIADVRNIKTGESPGLTRTQNSWELLMLLKLIDSLRADNGLVATRDYELLNTALIQAGLLTDDWNGRVVRWSRSTLKVGLAIFEIGAELESSHKLNLLQVVEVLRRAVGTLHISSRHMLALDGLDSIYIEGGNDSQSLAGLVQAVESLNRFFHTSHKPLAIVVALRSDIFNVLPTSESNKFKAYGVELDWALEGASSHSPLWTMVLHKGQAEVPSLPPLTETYLTRRAPIANGIEAPRFLLEYTRMLPRDLIEILKAIQRVHKKPGPVPGDKLVEAAEIYCREYFEGEIFNSLQGVLIGNDSSRKVIAFRDALRTLPSRVFSFDDVMVDLGDVVDSAEATALLRQMFEVGAIGIRNTSGGREEYTDFLYRRPGGAGFTRRHGFVLHNALVRGWNRPWR